MRLMWGAAHVADDPEGEENTGNQGVQVPAEALFSAPEVGAELASAGWFVTPSRRETSTRPAPPYSEPGIASP